MYICISVAIRWALQAPQSLSSQGCLSGAFSFRYLSSGAVLSPPRFPHYSLVFLFTHLTCIFSCLRTTPAMDMLRAVSASQAAEQWLMPESKRTYLVPKVQPGGTFCGQRGTGEQSPPAPRAASPPPDPAHHEPSHSSSSLPGFQRDRTWLPIPMPVTAPRLQGGRCDGSSAKN